MKSLENLAELNEVLKQQGLYAFYKHSSVCHRSAMALGEMEALGGSVPDLKVYQVLVLEHRPVSNEISEKLAVKHESPQFLLVKEGKCLWSISHAAIKAKSISEYLTEKKLLNH